jgi:hypothetical protein
VLLFTNVAGLMLCALSIAAAGVAAHASLRAPEGGEGAAADAAERGGPDAAAAVRGSAHAGGQADDDGSDFS